MAANKLKFALGAFVLLLISAFFWSDLGSLLSLESLRLNRDFLASYFSQDPLLVSSVFLSLYVIVATLSIPGAALLTLAAGAIFGLGYGTLISSVASSLGATLAFLGSRYFFRNLVEKHFRTQMEAINLGLKKEGSSYLLSLRLIPIFPFFIVNLLLGLTQYSVWRFFFVSQLGMLPGTFVYVNAGTQIAKIKSVGEILSPGLLLSFALVGLVPLLFRWMISLRKKKETFVKPKKFDFNLIVIGGGSGGLVSSYIASAVKAKVALIEMHKMGGDCLNTGCVPSKAFIRSAKAFKEISRSDEFGIKVESPRVHFAQVMERVQKVIGLIEPHDSPERYRQLGVECFFGKAHILSPYEVKVGDRVLSARNIIIATGARPLIPNIQGLELVRPLTSENVWSLREQPKRLLVLGGGPIGCELAQAFARLGTEVTLIEKGSRVLLREDEDVSGEVTQILLREKVRVLTSHKAVRVKEGSILICEHQGREIQVEFDQILFALGRKANVEGFGLEDLGLEVSDRGTLVADQYLRTTSFRNIFVCGDVTGPYQFTHAAAHQAWHASVNALFSPLKIKVDYRVIPWCTFCDPEVARVGLNELECKEQAIEYEVTKYHLDDLDRAIADGDARGFIKILTPLNSDKILGVTIVGSKAGDMITEFVLAMKHGLGLNKILSTIHIYPTWSEANKNTAGRWKQKNAPQFALKILKEFHRWRRG